ncbi:MAG: hypothetical protein Q8P83_02620 [bacterium]|nr:hypothetical protein [bacterium]
MIEFFEAKLQWKIRTLKSETQELSDVGLKIKESYEWKGKVVYNDVGAVVYFLKAIPWIVKGFSVDSHIEYLNRLQKSLDEGNKLKFTVVRYLIQGEK